MHDFDSMTVEEGLDLVVGAYTKTAADPSALDTIKNFATNAYDTVKANVPHSWDEAKAMGTIGLERAKEKLSGGSDAAGQGWEKAKAMATSPEGMMIGGGAGIGGALGLLSSHYQPKGRKKPVSRALLGALLGAGTGALPAVVSNLGNVTEEKKAPEVPSPAKELAKKVLSGAVSAGNATAEVINDTTETPNSHWAAGGAAAAARQYFNKDERGWRAHKRDMQTINKGNDVRAKAELADVEAAGSSNSKAVPHTTPETIKADILKRKLGIEGNSAQPINRHAWMETNVPGFKNRKMHIAKESGKNLIAGLATVLGLNYLPEYAASKLNENYDKTPGTDIPTNQYQPFQLKPKLVQ